MTIQLSAGTTYQFPITSGSGLALTLSAITLTDSAGTVTTETATGQTLNIAVPINAAAGVGAINYSYNDGSGVTAGTPIPVIIVNGSVPSTGAEQVLLGGKYQLSPPAGFTFGANPTLTLSNAAGTVVFGPAQVVDNGSATDLPTWTLTNVPLGTYTGVVDIVIDGAQQQIACAVNVVSSYQVGGVGYDFGPVYSDIDSQSASISASGTEVVFAGVSASVSASGASANPTAASAYLALTDGAEPLDSDWQAASWLTRTAGGAISYWAQLPIGPNAFSSGAYFVWARVLDGSQDARGRAGLIMVE